MAINWALFTEKAVGRGHPTETDVINRPLREVLSASGFDPDGDFTGFAGAVATAAAFLALNASNLTAGTIPDARVPASAVTQHQAALALSAAQLTAGTVPDARFPAALPAVSGANLTALNASNLGSGTVPVARVSGSYTGITGVGALAAGSIAAGFGGATFGGNVIFGTDGAYDIGAIGANRPRDVFVGRDLAVAGGTSIGGMLGVTGVVAIGGPTNNEITLYVQRASVSAGSNYALRLDHDVGGAGSSAAVDARLTTSGAAARDHIVSFQARATHGGPGTMNYIYGATVGDTVNAGAGTVGRWIGYHAQQPGGTGRIDYTYGVYVKDMATRGTLGNYAIYTEASTPSYFGGAVTVGSNLTATGNLTVGDPAVDVSRTVTIGSTATAAAGRVTQVLLDVPSAPSFLGTGMLYYRRAGVTAWGLGIVAAAAGAVSATSDLTFYNGSAHVAALSTAGKLRLSGGIDFTTDGAVSIGSAGANRPLDVFTARNVDAGGYVRAVNSIRISDAAGTTRFLSLQTAFTNRWIIAIGSGAESGADAGSEFRINAYTDAGLNIDSPIVILRPAGGAMSVSRPTTFAASLRIAGDIGFYNTAPVAKPNVSGSRGGNAALESLLTALASQGLITNSTVA